MSKPLIAPRLLGALVHVEVSGSDYARPRRVLHSFRAQLGADDARLTLVVPNDDDALVEASLIGAVLHRAQGCRVEGCTFTQPAEATP